MNIGFVGCGKLGLPVAVAIAMKGHDVMGYDIDPSRMSKKPQKYQEAGPTGHGYFNDYLKDSTIQFGSLEKVISHAEILFVAVQTPHDPEFEGVTPLTKERKDFDYSYLVKSIKSLVPYVDRPLPIAVISTVLPGTVRKYVEPLLNENCKLVYTPQFIAMGTTMSDYLNPEFFLLGVRDPQAAVILEGFYKTINNRPPVCKMSVESAELTKVAYNTYIGQKLVFVNTLMEVAHKIPGCDVDEVTGALKKATKRLISPTYLSAGLGDGGGCHPRDNVALSWLAKELKLSYNLFDSVMQCRENQAAWLGKLMMERYKDLPRVILGYAYKPGTNLTIGSAAILTANLLKEQGVKVHLVDPWVNKKDKWPVDKSAVFLIGCKHEGLKAYKFPKGSIVIDPWRFVERQSGVDVIYVGGKNDA